jgi:hypothetical protein
MYVYTVQVLAAAVSDSPSLELLSLMRNLMGDVSKSALLDAWAERSTDERFVSLYCTILYYIVIV